MRKGKPQSSILKRSVLLKVNSGMKKTLRPVPMNDYGELGEEVFVSNPVIGPLDDLLSVGIVPVINDMACSGAKPFGITINILLPVEFQEEDLKILMNFYAEECKNRGITILSGHTEVTDAVNTPVVNLTAIGKGAKKIQDKDLKNCDILIAGFAGLEATSWLLRHKGEELKEKFSDSFIRDAEDACKNLDVSKIANAVIELNAKCITNLSSGGVFEALWNMSHYGNAGFSVDLRKVPFKQHTIEFCEIFKLNPFQIRSQGAVLCAVEPGMGKEIEDKLLDMDIPARVIGSFNESNDRTFLNDEEARFLNMPEADDLLKLIDYSK